MLRLVRLYFSSSFKISCDVMQPIGLARVRNWVVGYALSQKLEGRFTVVLEDGKHGKEQSQQVGKKSKEVIDTIQWLGLYNTSTSQEQPTELLRQSERQARYKQLQKELVERQLAYPCFCPEGDPKQPYNGHCRTVTIDEAMKRVLAGHPYRIRFRNNQPLMKATDQVYGQLKQESQDQVDFVIAGTDQRPTARFMRIVDSVDVQLSYYISDFRHVGEMWHLLAVFRALQLTAPKIIHLPKVKLAASDPSTKVEWLRSMGYSPQAVLNTAVLLGWQPFGDRLENKLAKLDDQFTLQDIIQYFDVDKLTKQEVVYRKQKLDQLNRRYFKDQLKDLQQFKTKLVKRLPVVAAMSRQKLELVRDILRSGRVKGWWELTHYQFLFQRPALSQEFKKDYLKLFGHQHSSQPTQEQMAMYNENRLLLKRLTAIFEQPVKQPVVVSLAKQISVMLQQTGTPNQRVYGMLRLAVTGCNDQRLHSNILVACQLLGTAQVHSRLKLL